MCIWHWFSVILKIWLVNMLLVLAEAKEGSSMSKGKHGSYFVTTIFFFFRKSLKLVYFSMLIIWLLGLELVHRIIIRSEIGYLDDLLSMLIIWLLGLEFSNLFTGSGIVWLYDYWVWTCVSYSWVFEYECEKIVSYVGRLSVEFLVLALMILGCW